MRQLFVSIMLDETPDVMSKSQLSTVLRYVKEGDLLERFVGFTDINSEWSVRELFHYITNVVKEFKISSKLVGQTYNRAMSGYLNRLQSKVTQKYLMTLLHMLCHVKFSFTIGLPYIEECIILFQTLSGLTAFFQICWREK